MLSGNVWNFIHFPPGGRVNGCSDQIFVATHQVQKIVLYNFGLYENFFIYERNALKTTFYIKNNMLSPSQP